MKNPIWSRLAIPLCTAALLCTSALSAQENEGAQHELSLNASAFLTQFVPNNNGLVTSDYLLNYKLLFGPNSAGLRTGFGGNYSEDQGSLDGGEERSYELDANFRIGYERSTSFGQRWQMFYGFDFLTGYNREQFEFTSDIGPGFEVTSTNSSTVFDLGGGPVLGFRFKITDRISLFTESSLYFVRSSTEIKTEFSDSIFEDSSESVRNLNANFVLPTSVYFAVRF